MDEILVVVAIDMLNLGNAIGRVRGLVCDVKCDSSPERGTKEGIGDSRVMLKTKRKKDQNRRSTEKGGGGGGAYIVALRVFSDHLLPTTGV